MPTQWIEDWFGSEYYCLLYKHRGPDEAISFLDKLCALLHLTPGNKVLDCGCGRGRHSVYLAEKGFDVTGIDISEKNITKAKGSEKQNLAFYVHDKRNLFRINYYDAAISLFTSFGYFEKESENQKAIKSMTAALKQGGWFVMDFMNSTKEIKELIAEEKTECEGVRFNIRRFVRNNCIIKEIIVEEKGNTHTYRERVKAYRRSDLENFFSANGLQVIHLLGDYDLNTFDETRSERLILIGKKK